MLKKTIEKLKPLKPFSFDLKTFSNKGPQIQWLSSLKRSTFIFSRSLIIRSRAVIVYSCTLFAPLTPVCIHACNQNFIYTKEYLKIVSVIAWKDVFFSFFKSPHCLPLHGFIVLISLCCCWPEQLYIFFSLISNKWIGIYCTVSLHLIFKVKIPYIFVSVVNEEFQIKDCFRKELSPSLQIPRQMHTPIINVDVEDNKFIVYKKNIRFTTKLSFKNVIN